MREESWQKIDQIFNQAILTSNSKRMDYVEEICVDDPFLFDEIISLLESDNKSNEIFEQPLFPIVAQLLDADFVNLLKKSEFASYKLHKILGRGGTSLVFLAEDTRLERFIALKVMSGAIENNFDAILRFQQEAKASSAISHSNVAHVYEFGIYEEYYFIAMEYVEGKTLRELLKEKKVNLNFAIDIALQITKAISAAHKTGIAHRDIKPENIIINDDKFVKVVDFGLAKLNQKHRKVGCTSFETSPGIVIGTAAYMSPEQVRNEKVDEQTDLWSLGVVFYEMIAGFRPFQADTPIDVQAAILLTEPPPLLIAGEIPDLEKIVRKALMKDVSVRYQTAGEFTDDLQMVRRQVYDFDRRNEQQKTPGQENTKENIYSESNIPGRMFKLSALPRYYLILLGTALFAAFLFGAYLT